MFEERAQEQRILLWLMLLSSFIGVMFWYVQRVSLASFGEFFSTTVTWISFFTNITNVLIVVMAVSLLFGNGRLHQWFSSPIVQSALCLYIFFVGFTYWLLLGDPSSIEGLNRWIPEILTHTLSPILGVVYWIRVIPWGHLKWRYAVIWLAYPIAYLVYWLIRGPIVNDYPYFFIDVNSQGYAGVAMWSGALIVMFIIGGTIMWGCDRAFSPKS